MDTEWFIISDKVIIQINLRTYIMDMTDEFSGYV